MDSTPVKIHYESKISDGRYIQKIELEGHTYIYLRNNWNCAGDNLIHDPGCKCFNLKSTDQTTFPSTK